ncbi:tetratricopeptide repeat protein [Novosphingobium olei]|uniref:Tetratricopeptide repeat protein n=1 Tax=Novosphingobium olei TaxID=2728851 RepID=A0A7Y0BPE2_9SPHN|nr:hypothetical protein [Novosphingobium olei]NML94034.1 hypothetical protein [Novosphingobium olei]
MRGSFGKFGKSAAARAALGLAIVTGVAAGGFVPAVASAKEKEAKGGKVSNSPEFVKAAQAFQPAFTAAQGQTGDAQKTAGQALVPQLAAIQPNVKTPADQIIFGQWQQSVGNWVGDGALVRTGLQNMLDSGQLPADKVSLVQFFIGAKAYEAKDYAGAIKALQPVVAANYTDDVAAEMLAESYAQTGNPKAGLDALKQAIAARKAAGGVAPEAWYSRANRIAYNGKLNAETGEWAIMLAQAYPTSLNWLGATQLVRNSSQFTAQENLDLGRLMDRSGALKADPKYTEREYVDYIQAADARRNPGEVIKVAQEGLAAGALKSTDTFVSDAMTQAKGRIAADKASLPGLAKDAAAAANGVTANAAGDAYLQYGEAAKAEEFYKLALTKGGIDKDRALTRLGIAQADQAKWADAKASFAQVTGIRAPMAKLWTVWVDQKAAGK